MNTTIKQIKQIFKDNDIQNKDIKHDLKVVKIAANQLSDEYGVDNANDIIKLVFFNEPIANMYTHSYGFHTRQGRAIIEQFKELYYRNI